ncbi:hypothetical protein [Paludisphaera soli]|uniref:hypothetical protein n=1 Tax=Paludisphaera soli TaxID=2712865 RepID=UPI0013E9CC54|nr:hypothetical protein [Paludisphaera soli]
MTPDTERPEAVQDDPSPPARPAWFGRDLLPGSSLTPRHSASAQMGVRPRLRAAAPAPARRSFFPSASAPLLMTARSQHTGMVGLGLPLADADAIEAAVMLRRPIRMFGDASIDPRCRVPAPPPTSPTGFGRADAADEPAPGRADVRP